jgi:porin
MDSSKKSDSMKHMQIRRLILFLILVNSTLLQAQTESEEDTLEEAKANARPAIACARPKDSDSGDTATPEPDPDGCQVGDSLSDYDQSIPATSESENTKSVETELIRDDTVKPAIFPIDHVHSRLCHVYKFKEDVNDRFGLAWGVDYSILYQHASFTQSGRDTASSSVFRFLGTWLRLGDREGTSGNLVWKVETRNPIFGNPTPRDMGFDTGSALSTANYKVLDYWGVTDLYWKQRFRGGKYAFLAGHMDPGDWADQYPMLNAWTAFLNDAFYNNPTEAIPKRGFGLVGQVFFNNNMYLLGGVHDANGKDGKLDFSSFWSTREFFSWVELGYRGSALNVSSRRNTHIHFWHQDRREQAGVEASKGVVFTHSVITQKDHVAFVRAGYSKGDAAQMRRFIGVGVTFKLFGRDRLGLATSWGSPPDKSLRNQITSEAFYRIQVTQHLTFTPSFQLTYKPSLTLEKDWVFIPGLRMRFVF